MTTTIDSVERIGPQSWRIIASSDLVDPTFYWWRDGVRIGQGEAESIEVTALRGEYPIIEVFDAESDEPLEGLPARLVLHWRRDSALDANGGEYLVEEDVSGTWTTRATIRHRADRPWYQYRTRTLEDQTTHDWRVTAITSGGATGTVSQVSALLVRVPDPPDLSFSYDSGAGEVTAT